LREEVARLKKENASAPIVNDNKAIDNSKLQRTKILEDKLKELRKKVLIILTLLYY
jgi:hypothetical protein